VPFVDVLGSLREGVHTENVIFDYGAFGIGAACAFHVYERKRRGFHGHHSIAILYDIYCLMLLKDGLLFCWNLAARVPHLCSLPLDVVSLDARVAESVSPLP
jgi:hypothetical protein